MFKLKGFFSRINPTLLPVVVLAAMVSIMLYAEAIPVHLRLALVWLLAALVFLTFTSTEAESDSYIDHCHKAISERDAVIEHQQQIINVVKAEYEEFRRALRSSLNNETGENS